VATVTIKDIHGKSVGTMELDDSIFGIKVNEHAVHMAVVQYLANQRQGTKSTKTRAEVRGGGRKPWRQKGTGRARQGSIRSPQWTGGGVVFAPKPRDYSVRLNKKLKRLALKSVLTDKLKQDKLVILDSLQLSEVKTKAMVDICSALSTDSKKPFKALFVMDIPAIENQSGKKDATPHPKKCHRRDSSKPRPSKNNPNKNVILSARNIPTIEATGINTINVYEILKYDNLVLTKDAVLKMQEVYA
jgi:large subunit ribosomal protein L4